MTVPPTAPGSVRSAPRAAVNLASLPVLTALVACGAESPPAEPPPPRRTLAFVDVGVVSMDTEQVVAGQTVVVADGRIVDVGPSDVVSVPGDALRVDGAGRYLMPGLAEMHGHLPTGDERRGVAEQTLLLYVANGVTLVRSMNGHPAQLALRDAVARGDALGPRLVLAGPSLGGEVGPEEARRRVGAQAEAGYDLVKVTEGLSSETYEAVASASHEAGLAFVGHVPDGVGLLRALEAGPATIEHLDNYVEALIPAEALGTEWTIPGLLNAVEHADESRIPSLVEATLASGAATVPTMALWDHLAGGRSGDELRSELPELHYLPAEVVNPWVQALNGLHGVISDGAGGRRLLELRRAVLRSLHEAGATILLGTDSPQMFNVPGFSVHREMALMVQSGLTPWEVLRTATRNVAEHMGELDSSGTVEPGRRADLILLEANPLDDVGNVARRAGVVVDGRWLPEEEIRRRLEGLVRSAGSR